MTSSDGTAAVALATPRVGAAAAVAVYRKVLEGAEWVGGEGQKPPRCGVNLHADCVTI